MSFKIQELRSMILFDRIFLAYEGYVFIIPFLLFGLPGVLFTLMKEAEFD